MSHPMNLAAVLVGALVLLIALISPFSTAFGGCPTDADIDAMAGQILAAEPVDLTGLDISTVADGRCAQDKLVAALTSQWGEVVGYKAGLTSAAAQAKFGVAEPVAGRLFKNGLLKDGARVPANWGALPRFEADVLVEVADARINQAKTEAEVLDHLSAIYPFIELPDLVAADPQSLTGPLILAINVGARYGVLGRPIALGRDRVEDQDLLAALAEMQVVATDQQGEELLSASGSAILGHPLKSVLWLLGQGVRFAPGDLVSLGSLGPLFPPQPGMTVTVTYRGLPGDPSVGVSFE